MKVALISIMKRPTLKLNRVMSFETKVLIKDELLRKYVYINSSYDIKKILSIVKNNKSLYHQLLVNQLNEYKTLSFYQ